MKVREIIEQIKDGIDIFNTKYFYIDDKKQTVETCVIDWILLSNDLDGIREQVSIIPEKDFCKTITIGDIFITKREAKEHLNRRYCER